MRSMWVPKKFYILVIVSFLIAGVAAAASFVTVGYVAMGVNDIKTVILSGQDFFSPFIPFPSTSATLPSSAQNKPTSSPKPDLRNAQALLAAPPEAAKVLQNRFLASKNFPANEKTSIEELMLAVGDTACGYNKIKGLQCGGATAVMHDQKGACIGTTPIPYDPCCGAPPEYVDDPRDTLPRCPEPACAGNCYCAPPPAGCEPILFSATNPSPSIARAVADCSQSPDLDACCQANPGAIGCTIEVHKECINGACYAVPGPGAGDPQCANVADGDPCGNGGSTDCSVDPNPQQCCAQNPNGKGCEDDCTNAPDDDACCRDNPQAKGCRPDPPSTSSCLPLACNCVCAARAGGGDFSWLWDSVTGYCGCNP